jgi:FkbM family methyltransferase
MKLRDDLAALLPRLREADLPKFCAFYEKYAPHLAAIAGGLYDRLVAADQARFLVWFLKRWGRIDLVNKVERGLYETTIARVKNEERAVETLGGGTYKVRDFKSQGHDFALLGYDWVLGVHDVLYNQYEHGDVKLEAGDVIIDAGAFIGDTAVYFHHKLGGQCQVHSFELLDENLALLVHNLERNGIADDRVVVNKFALADTTGAEILVSGGNAQSAASMFRGAAGGQGERVQTITLDDYVVGLGLERVDFIKMDIEGAEAMALKGARQTIAHFRPRLAICLYHKWDDVFTLPPLIDATGVDYAYAFKWVQLTDGWEAVLLATPAERATPRAIAAPAAAPAAGDPLAAALAVLTKAYAKKSAQAEALARAQRQPPEVALHAGPLAAAA